VAGLLAPGHPVVAAVQSKKKALLFVNKKKQKNFC
jgi:hypothetical protein